MSSLPIFRLGKHSIICRHRSCHLRKAGFGRALGNPKLGRIEAFVEFSRQILDPSAYYSSYSRTVGTDILGMRGQSFLMSTLLP